MDGLVCGVAVVLTALVTTTLSYRTGARRRRRRRGLHRPAGGDSRTMRVWPGRRAAEEVAEPDERREEPEQE